MGDTIQQHTTWERWVIRVRPLLSDSVVCQSRQVVTLTVCSSISSSPRLSQRLQPLSGGRLASGSCERSINGFVTGARPPGSAIRQRRRVTAAPASLSHHPCYLSYLCIIPPPHHSLTDTETHRSSQCVTWNNILTLANGSGLPRCTSQLHLVVRAT